MGNLISRITQTLLCIVGFICLMGNAHAQLSCGTDYDEYVSQFNSEENNQHFLPYCNENLGAIEIVEVPIVVHIVHNGEQIGGVTNPDDEQVQEVVDKVNQYFKLGYWGVDCKIKLVLAKRDQYDGATSGITRIDGSQYTDYVDHGVTLTKASCKGVEINTIKSGTFWNPKKYLNIWVVNYLVVLGDDGCKYVGGHSRFPWQYRDNHPERDGVIVPSINPLSETIDGPFYHGSSVAHEVGHS